ncbi:MAG: hypothetical protein JWR05_550 [Mucilaginibacter sp.]|nr:hypothetical protein [Mucilaginibacter sp.]
MDRLNDKMEETGSTFSIANDTNQEMIIVHEPECFEFKLPVNEELEVETRCCKDSILLRTSVDDEGKVVIRVFDDVSLYKVIYKGEDIFKKYLDD